MRPFNGNELHKGLSAEFKHWVRGFRDELEMAQQAFGINRPEKYKISKLGECLRGEAGEFFNKLRDEWWEIEPTLDYVIEEMESAFSQSFTSAQVSELFTARKSSGTSWHTHYLYLMVVRNETDASSALIPESQVLQACPEMRLVLASQHNKKRNDYVVHTLEIPQWAQTYEDNERKTRP
ncbi:unnamed protein product [Phytophthora fragariaefolia]|uniref:Unnamed protein product n=1 Tax=Phytophthora fragariaefolia TaxID=1490495 RepID=A0A9W6XG26_9STRA|nr:unnamed protein product [Phytophthora fragariaefolia]